MAQETQITFKLTKEELELLKKAGKLVGLGHTTFARSCSIERAREILIKNNIILEKAKEVPMKINLLPE